MAMCFLLVSTAAQATDGYVNPAFGGATSNAGTVELSTTLDTTHGGPPLEYVRLAEQSDGRIVVVAPASNGTLTFTRLTALGALDTSFNGSGSVAVSTLSPDPNVSTDLLIQPSGAIVGIGYATPMATAASCVAFRLLGTGALDSSFHGTGKYSFAAPSSTRTRCFRIRPQSNGSLLIAGDQLVSNASVMMIARLNGTTGAADATFGSAGLTHSTLPSGFAGASAFSVAQLPNGQIVAVGYAYETVSNTNKYYWDITRFSATGVFDTGFGTAGHLLVPFTNVSDHTLDSAFDIIPDSDNGFVVVGNLRNTSLATVQTAVIKFTATGAFDSTFGQSAGETSFDFSGQAVAAPSEMIVDRHGRFVGVGYSQFAFEAACPTCYGMTVFRLTSNGIPDASFGVGGGVDYVDAQNGGNLQGTGIAIAADEGLLIAVHAQTGTSTYNAGLFKLIGDTVFTGNFEPTSN
ncbi:MAG TPA: hypothetical protein VH082_00700 [Rudaea sp.]|jgi:uncharacterized delta-60 repeat protein|nr:hypothetical protein [Rudaea sp.]